MSKWPISTRLDAQTPPRGLAFSDSMCAGNDEDHLIEELDDVYTSNP